MDLEISPGDIDRTHRRGVPNKNKNRPLMIKFVRYIDQRQVFTLKKRLQGKDTSNTKSLTKIRITTLNEARNEFGCRSIWTADGKMMFKAEGEAKAKVYFEWLAVVLWKNGNCL